VFFLEKCADLEWNIEFFRGNFNKFTRIPSEFPTRNVFSGIFAERKAEKLPKKKDNSSVNQKCSFNTEFFYSFLFYSMFPPNSGEKFRVFLENLDEFYPNI
jgi:hypothetical protein